MNLQLRTYQQDIINKTYQVMLAGSKRPIVVLPCGGGKTVVFAYLASQTQKKGNNVWFLVHRRELLDQTKETFTRFNIPIDNIFIGMVATVANRLDKYDPPDLIVFDECQHCAAATWQRIIDHHPQAWLIGLTATPCRLDGKPLGAIFDKLVLGPTVQDLINLNYLSPYKYLAPSIADLTDLKIKGSDYDREQAAGMMMQRAIYGDVIKHWREHANGYQTIIYCTTIKHSQAVADAFQAAGIRAQHFDGTTPAQERRQIVADFRDKRITVLCNVDLIGEGFDVPDCWCCVLLRPTMSTGLFIQQSGRALRPQAGKTAIILDHVGNYVRHGLPATDRDWSLSDKLPQQKEYREDGQLTVRQCEMCYTVFETGPDKCPVCGYPVAKTQEEIKNIEEIKLKEITEQQAKQQRQQYRYEESQARSYQDLLIIAKSRGYNRGWAYHRAKARGYKIR